MLQLWRITMRKLAYIESERFVHAKEIAIKSRSEIEAVAFAKKNIHSPEWWEGFIITEVKWIGELWAAEGFTCPMEED